MKPKADAESVISAVRASQRALEKFSDTPRTVVMSAYAAEKTFEHFLKIKCKITNLCPDDRIYVMRDEDML